MLAAGDPSGALTTLCTVPRQVLAATGIARALDLSPPVASGEVAHVLCCGMGGSGAGLDALAAAAQLHGRVPFSVHKGYGVPAHCGPGTFVIASSYSGETEETLDAFRAARAAGARGAVITSGGTLAREASAAGWPVAEVEGGLMPRLALGWMTALPAEVCRRAGLLGGADGEMEALTRRLEGRVSRWGPEAPTQDNVAKALAHELKDGLPVVWGLGPVGAAAAVRWKSDLNENAKVFAHAASLPELCHNEIVAWAPEAGVGLPQGRRVLICLGSEEAGGREAERLAATLIEVKDSFDLVWETTGQGDGPLSRFCDLALLGGLVSVYLALLRGVDPAPIDAISRLKRSLAGS